MLDILMEHLGKGFLYMLIISMPIVLAAAGIGLVVGILQAVTQVQEQTIAAAPKILGVFLVIIMMGGFFTKILVEYFQESVHLAFYVVPKIGDFVLPPAGQTSQGNNFFDPKNYAQIKRPKIDHMMKNPGKVPFNDDKQKMSVSSGNVAPVSIPNLVESKKIYGK